MRILFVLGTLISLSACGGGEDGEALFGTHCATCHGADGAGVASVGPSLGDRVPGLTEADVAAIINSGADTESDDFSPMLPVSVSAEEADAIAAHVVATWGS